MAAGVTAALLGACSGPTDTSVASSGLTSSSVEPTATPGETSRWIPSPGVHWQWVLDHPLQLDDPADMGTDRKASDGSPADRPTVFDIDGFANDAATIAELHRQGAHVICYVEVGGWEDHRADSATFPAAAIGNPVDGYPDERYLDIRSPDVVRLILDRIEMCAAKGFDAVEPDLDDTYTANTGFPLTQRDQVAFNSAVAAHAHALGMSIALKNGDEQPFTDVMEPIVDFAIVEQCFEFDSCDAYAAFAQAGKAVLEVEYNLAPQQFCDDAATLGFSAVLHDPALAGGGTPCR